MLSHVALTALLAACYVADAMTYKNVKEEPHLLVPTEHGVIKGDWNKGVGDDIGRRLGMDMTKLSRMFLSIPFAAPPVGPNRFRSPQPLQSKWGSVSADGSISGSVREATSWPKACKQNFFDSVPDSEDCLYLNVFTPPPKRVGGRTLPVMVWIYGGAFFFGDSYEDGAFNARQLTNDKDVVVVTLNHRVGAFGFFDSDETGTNFGIEDQRAALLWVKKNIANFGGDVDNITLYALSSGAASVSIHLTSPLTPPGLFHRAIHQSGPLGTQMRKRKDLQKTSRDLADNLKCLTNGKVDVDCMRRVSASDILKYTKLSNDISKSATEFAEVSNRTFTSENTVSSYLGDQYNWWPSIDGKNIVGQPRDLMAQGKVMDIPIIFGLQEREAGSWFVPFDIPIRGSRKKEKKYNRDAYTKLMRSIFGRDLDKVTKLYPIHDSAESNVGEMISITSDYAFVCPAKRAAENLSKSNRNIYVYMWTQATYPLVPRCLSGACHGNELPYMFNTILPLIGSRRRRLRKQVWSYWTNFAATGNPNLRAGSNKQDTSVPVWPRFEPTVGVVQELGDKTGPRGPLRPSYCKLWNDDLGYSYEASMDPVTIGEVLATTKTQQQSEKDKDKLVEKMKQEEAAREQQQAQNPTK